MKPPLKNWDLVRKCAQTLMSNDYASDVNVKKFYTGSCFSDAVPPKRFGEPPSASGASKEYPRSFLGAFPKSFPSTCLPACPLPSLRRPLLSIHGAPLTLSTLPLYLLAHLFTVLMDQG